jgi:2-dehydro-3-deoxyphosphogalactonate aldolase
MREPIGILPGLRPRQSGAIGKVLLASAIAKIEVPLNSPQVFESAAILAHRFGGL